MPVPQLCGHQPPTRPTGWEPALTHQLHLRRLFWAASAESEGGVPALGAGGQARTPLPRCRVCAGTSGCRPRGPTSRTPAPARTESEGVCSPRPPPGPAAASSPAWTSAWPSPVPSASQPEIRTSHPTPSPPSPESCHAVPEVGV